MSTDMPATEEPRLGRPLPPEAVTLEDDDLRKVAAALVQGEDPEQGWIRYLRTLTLLALHRWLKQRDAAVVVGPELEPEAPDRLLAIGGRATQLLCASSLAEEVAVPLSPWKQTATAPQLVLLALVDEENAVVEFPGVIDAAALIAEIQKVGGGADDAIELPKALFQGGLERLLRWVTLLEPEALPRVGLSGPGLSREAERGGLEELKKWLNQLLSGPTLVPVPVVGTRGSAPTEVRLITPVVQKADDGSLMAQAVCATPSIWAAVPLAEIELVADGQVLWQQRASRGNPIEGPIAWPLDALQPQRSITIRLRPQGAPGGAYAVVSMQAADASVMQEGQEAIRLGLQDETKLFSWEDELLPNVDRHIAFEIMSQYYQGMALLRLDE
jgi:hypothetical protein